MAKKEHYFTQFEPERYYHVYNRSVDLKPMFTQPRNYEFFLERLNKYLTPVLDVYSYCLMNNHFHLLVKIKDWDVFEEMNNTKSDLTNLILYYSSLQKHPNPLSSQANENDYSLNNKNKHPTQGLNIYSIFQERIHNFEVV